MADPRARVILEAVRRGDAAFTSFQKDLEAVATKAAYMAGVVATGLAALTIASLKSIDALTDEADALGISTDKLAGLQLAAKLAGVDAEQFNRAIAKQTRTIADAVQGSTEAQKAFVALGLSYRELAQLSPDQQFSRITAALQDVENVTLRAGLASDIYGSKTYQMLNVLALTEDQLRSAQEQAERFGVAISRVDAAKVQAAADALDLVQAKVKGFGNFIAVEVSPYITELANRFLGVGGSAEEMRDRVHDAVETIGRAVGLVADAFYGWQLIFAHTRMFWLETVATFVEGFQTIVTAAGTVKAAILDALNIQPAIERVAEIEERLANLGDKAQPGLRAGLQRLLDELKAEAALEVPIVPQTGALEVLVDSLRQSADEARVVFENLAAADRPSAVLAETMARVRAEAEATARAVADAVPAADTGGALTETEAERKAKDAARQKVADDLERLRESFLSAEQVELEALSRRQGILDAARETGLVDEQRYYDLSAELAARHWAKMQAMAATAAKAQKAARLQAVQSNLSVVAGVLGALNTLTEMNADRSKQAFETNKKVGIANAIVSTAVGVAKALEGPFPWNLINSAIVLAAGLAQVQSIRSTSWSGGGTVGSAGGGGGSGAVASTSPVPEAQVVPAASRQGVVLNVTVAGSIIGRGGARQLAEDLTELLRDHVELSEDVLIRPTSRNGRALAGAG